MYDKINLQRKEISMKINTDILKGKWNQLKGDLKIKWGELTDDDVDQIDGSIDKLVGVLQERYGYSRDEADREIKEWVEPYQ